MAALDRLASAAAMTAAKETVKELMDRHPTHDEMAEIADKAIERFLERVGIDDIPAFRKDLTAMRAAREMREALISHGLKAVVTVLFGGICTAVWLAIKGAR
jgi:adenine/guanine phosphoribosyltransferase-like PRPP-binding protein